MVSSIIRATLIVNFALMSTSLVIPRVAPGTQFITGPCTSDQDCASGCCNAKTAQCAARLVALETFGCGFGSPSAGAGAALPLPATATVAVAATAADAASTTVAAAASTGTQFITGACETNDDCASGCCGLNSGLCAARAVALEGVGCRDGTSAASTSVTVVAVSPAVETLAPTTTAAAAASTGTQFITGVCETNDDCASGCCGLNSGLCAARLVALEGVGCRDVSSSPAAGAASTNSVAVAAPPAVAATTTASAAASTGTQFITGACNTNDDCASGCCGLKSGLCAARLVALEGAGCRDA